MLSIRPSTYRGKQGYKISGRRPGQEGGWSVSIFTETRESAVKIKAKVKAGEPIEASDWLP